MLNKSRAVGCWRRSGLTLPWRRGGGLLRNPLRWSTSVQLWVFDEPKLGIKVYFIDVLEVYLISLWKVRNMREERINSGGAFKSELFKGGPTRYILWNCSDVYLVWCVSDVYSFAQLFARRGDRVCLRGVPSAQRRASTTDSQWRWGLIFTIVP